MYVYVLLRRHVVDGNAEWFVCSYTEDTGRCVVPTDAGQITYTMRNAMDKQHSPDTNTKYYIYLEEMVTSGKNTLSSKLIFVFL